MKLIRSSLRSKFWATFMSALLVFLVVTQGIMPVAFQGRTLTGELASILSTPKDATLQNGSASAEQGVAESVVSSESGQDSTTSASKDRSVPPLAQQLAPNAPNAPNAPSAVS
ncbi:MAG: hypothetical protein M3441_21445, partial [Chloroflexota bacterium]|nr:hypothetical protein [Chloroflexota bacterium]